MTTLHVCPICKRVKPVPNGTPATCQFCSEQMVKAGSVRGLKILESENSKEIRK